MSATSEKRLKVSREGVVLIKSFEGFRASAQPRPDGGWVIGYGHTRSAREGLTVSESDAELLLQYDLIPVVAALNAQAPVWINQHQFDALASYAFSVGLDRFEASPVLERLRAGSADEAADAMVGSPEIAPADVVLRRRAAERALFVADAASPVTLAQLMAAPLPLPAPPSSAATEPHQEDAPAEDAASEPSAGEIAVHASAEDPQTAADAEPNDEAVETVTADADADAFNAEIDESPEDAGAEVTPSIQAEGAGIEAPAGVEEDAAVETTPEPAPESAASDVDGEAPAEPVAEDASTADATAEASVGPEPSDEMAADAEPETSPSAVTHASSTPLAASVSASLRMSPYAGVLIGPIPGLGGAVSATAPAPDAAVHDAALPPETSDPVVVEDVPEAQTNTFETAPDAPVLDAPRLVLTPLDEEETPVLRPLWSDAERGITTTEESPLFEEVLHPASTNILRHEAEIAPRRTDWPEFGAFAAMGGIGLVSFGAAVAGFRKAADEGPDGAQLAVVGWVLLLIALICVGVSGYNLFRAWTADRKSD